MIEALIVGAVYFAVAIPFACLIGAIFRLPYRGRK